MLSVLPAVVVCSTVIFLYLRAEPFLRRLLKVAEARADIYRDEVLKPVGVSEVPMPRDFIDWAMNESTEWAREDKLARMRELYGRLRDWEKVRQVLMHEEETALKATF